MSSSGCRTACRHPLGKTHSDGAERRAGQWQKFALARAMTRAEPLLLILDEPTSALEAHAEHVLFERYAASARSVAKTTGGIAIFVSHRFSTVRMADSIVALDLAGSQSREATTNSSPEAESTRAVRARPTAERSSLL